MNNISIEQLNKLLVDFNNHLPLDYRETSYLDSILVNNLLRIIAVKRLLSNYSSRKYIEKILPSYEDTKEMSLSEYVRISEQFPELYDTLFFRELSVRYKEFDSWNVNSILSGNNPNISNVISAIRFARSNLDYS